MDLTQKSNAKVRDQIWLDDAEDAFYQGKTTSGEMKGWLTTHRKGFRLVEQHRIRFGKRFNINDVVSGVVYEVFGIAMRGSRTSRRIHVLESYGQDSSTGPLLNLLMPR